MTSPSVSGRTRSRKSAEDTNDVLDELVDRYGEPPDSVNGLLDVSLVRVTAANAGFTEITQRGDMLLLYGEALDVEKNPAQPEHIRTKWGVGYYFKY